MKIEVTCQFFIRFFQYKFLEQSNQSSSCYMCTDRQTDRDRKRSSDRL